MHQPPKQEQICSISELTAGIKRALMDAYPVVWVKGEVSNLRYQSSGHIYFSLKDQGAQISAVLFRANASKLKMQLKDGMEVIALGNLSVYEPRGSYQLVIRECIEEGAGRLQAEFERLKKQLHEEGLFDSNRKQPLPLLPRRLGIVTSPTGAALRDFLSILHRRKWTGQVILFPAVVQGKEGGPDIVEKLKWAESYADLDLVVICRGGGSIEDLWNFNEETVVRAVSAMRIPVISAVGHEIDFVLTDFASDKRAETPSAAAELISSSYIDAHNRLKDADESIQGYLCEHMRSKQVELAHAGDRLRAHTPTRVLENRHLRLDELQERINSRIQIGFAQKQHRLMAYGERIRSLSPTQWIERKQEWLGTVQQRFSKETRYQLQAKAQQLESDGKRLSGLGVDNVLKRGYAVIRDQQGKVVSNTAKLKNGRQVEIQLKDGRRLATIRNAEQLDFFSSP